MLSKKALSASASAPEALYVEDVASVYLYTGNGSTQTITNNVDLSGEGGLVWIKSRSAATDHQLFDTERGATKELISNSTAAEATDADTLTAFNADGFSLGADSNTNTNAATYASFTFRQAKKFFDVVTYTGTGTNRTIAHNLGSVPGMIIVKRTSAPGAGGNWQVYHRSVGNSSYMVLNNTDSATADSTRWNNTTPTSSVFSLGTDTNVNSDGATYVAYLFAHDAGGFGAAGTDNVISCGSFTTDGSGNATVSLGYEPQWLMIKSTATQNWFVFDNMREWSLTNQNILRPNLSDAELSVSWGNPTATGFTFDKGNLSPSQTFIYMAIRRPMKPPTSGTEVFSPNATSASQGTKLTTGFPIDLQLAGKRNGDSDNMTVIDRMRKFSSSTTESNGNFLETSQTVAENTAASESRARYWDNTGFQMPGAYAGDSFIFWNFRRAPKFFDIVCYTGTGSTTTDFSHNLGVVPELIIFKRRDSATGWGVWRTATGTGNNWTLLNSNGSEINQGIALLSSTPTNTKINLSTWSGINASGGTYVAYLFATLAGVSKVFSYTGNGSSQTINCGFSAGARLVLIKRTDSTGDWYIWDSSRGIVSGNDPRLSLNSTAAEVTSDDTIDPDSSGFVVNQVSATNVNVSSATYIGLAIA